MRTLNSHEVELVSGGTWADFWGSVAKFFQSLFGSGDGTSNPVAAQVTLCTSNGGSASYTVNGSAYNVTANAGGNVPVDGMVIPISVSAAGSQSSMTYSVTCQGADGSSSGTTITHNAN